MKVKVTRHQESRRRGFALVVTLSVTSLLVILVTGLLLTTRSSSAQLGARLESARGESHAILASRLALGSLQKALGPDQRVTAPAALFWDSEADAVHFTGVWDTKDWDPVAQPVTRSLDRLVQPLASVADSGVAADWNNLPAPDRLQRLKQGPGADSALLLGPVSVADPADQVRADLINLEPSGAAGARIAWWASDESQKATLYLPDSAERTEDPDLNWNLGLAAGNLGAAHAEIAGLLAAVPDHPTETPLVTRSSVALTQPASNQPLAWHDLSVASDAVFSDVRNGGLRRDLSLAFEADRGQWATYPEFHNVNEKGITDSTPYQSGHTSSPLFYHQSNSPNLGYLFLLDGSGMSNAAANALLRGPSWDVLQNHYRSYKREWDALNYRGLSPSSAHSFVARPIMPADYSYSAGQNGNFTYFIAACNRYGKGFSYDPYKTSGRSSATPIGLNSYPHLYNPLGTANQSPGDTNRPRQAAMQPVITRACFAYGLTATINGRVVITFDPYFTLWNPYDVPLDVATVGMHISKFRAFRYRINYTQGGVSYQTVHDFSQNNYDNGSVEYRFVPQGGRLTLQPGEFITVSPTLQPAVREVQWAGRTFVSGSRSYSEGPSGLALFTDRDARPDANSMLTATIESDMVLTGTYQGEIMSATFAHFLPNVDGSSYVQPMGTLASSAHLTVDMPLLQMLNFHSQPNTLGRVSHTITRNMNQIPRYPSASRYYFAALDLTLDNPVNGDSAIAAQSNPRAQVVDPRDTAVLDRMAPSWNYTLVPLNGDVTPLSLVNFDGGGTLGSLDRLSLYETPRRPLTSLASFQSANATEFTNGQGLAIGNSWPNSMARELDRIRATPWSLAATEVAGAFFGQEIVDWSWAANDSLWDRYFLSGANWGAAPGQPFPTATAFRDAARDPAREANPFANRRVRRLPSVFASGGTNSAEQELLLHDRIARHLTQAGAFNVNSTSVDAWMAVLAGNADTAFGIQADNGAISSERSPADGTRFGRFQLARPGTDSNRWMAAGINLDSSQLRRLAEKIVDQVRLRGPFFGLADFVNRRLTNDDTGRIGALQAAIDAAAINPGSAAANHATLAQKHTPIAAGTPTQLSQADLLTSLAPALTSRGDTFTVRALARNQDASGRVSGQRVLEVAMQRLPERLSGDAVLDFTTPVTAVTHRSGLRPIPQVQENAGINPTDRRFGRRFRIVSMRWISPEQL